MKMSSKRDSLLCEIYEKGSLYASNVNDKRSLNWLELNGFITVSIIANICRVTDKGIDYLSSQPAFN